MKYAIKNLVLIGAIAGAAGARDRGWWHEHGCASCQLAAQIASMRALQGTAAFDESTGRDLRVFPHHRPIDIIHQRIEMTIADMDDPVAPARTVIEFEPRADMLEKFELDSVLLDVSRVSVEGRQARFKADGATLEISVSPPIPRGERSTLVIEYTIRDPQRGLTWTPSSPAWPDRPPQIHTQGQPQDNSSWFPTHDFPNEKMTTELVVAVPEGFIVSGNGRLADRWLGDAFKADGTRVPVEVFEWLQEPDHPAYLVSLIVGKFDIIDVGDGTIPMPVYVPPGRGGDIEGTYGDTLAMTRLYERLFDEPYPWARYAQLVVWNFDAGGMENTAATTMFDTAIIAQDELDDHDLLGLISHEVAHQWFGNLVTCTSWEHLWLNEGFATYLESLWFEADGGLDEYLVDTLANYDSVIARDDGIAPIDPAMASGAYVDPLDVFRKPANPYPKGAATLHMLRTKIGDEAFFGGLAAFLDRYRLKSVDTGQLMDVLEESSGSSLERFFDQWVWRPGIPRLSLTNSWADGTLTIEVEQTQHIDGANPAFWFDLPVVIESGGQRTETLVQVRERTNRVELAIDAEPTMVAIDPQLAVLAELSIEQPVSWLVEQLERGPSLPSRVHAARHLADIDLAEAHDALLAAARSKVQHVRVREEAVRGLGGHGDAANLAHLLDDPEWRIRRTAVAELGDLDDVQSTTIDRLQQIARQDTSTRTRSSAIAALAILQGAGATELALELTGVESQHDGLRQAALRALAAIGPDAGERALDTAIRYAQIGAINRTRPAAISAIRALAEVDRPRAIAALIPLLDDREERTIGAAGDALSQLGGPEAIRALERHAALQTDVPRIRRANGWLAELASGSTTR